jgi:branched-chain amino acid transport system permease protein
MTHPRSAFGAPPQGGAAGGPAEPDPRRPLGPPAVHVSRVAPGAVVLCATATLAAIGLPWLANDYLVGVGLTLLMWMALTLSWCVLSKMTGYVSLGHVVFYGLGAYLVVVSWQTVPLWLAIPAAGMLAAAFAAIVGLPVLRVRGPYFVILTFGLAELVKYSIIAFESASGVASRILFGAPDLVTIYFAMLALALAAVLLLTWVANSRFGHGLRSLREDEEAAETLGVPVARYKLIAFVLSAAIPGMVGGVMALRSTYFVTGGVFDPMISVTVIAMALLGGGDNAKGPMLGVIFLALLSEVLWAQAPLLYMVILGAILVVFVLVLPNGLMGWFDPRRQAAAAQGPR